MLRSSLISRSEFVDQRTLDFFGIYVIRIKMADFQKMDVKFSADMLLKLIEKFNGEYPEELNSFKEGEALELLSAEDLSTKLYRNFGVDVERVRSVLNKDALSQTDLVSLAHFAIEISNETPSVKTRKRSGADADGTSNKKKKQGEESTVSCFCFASQK